MKAGQPGTEAGDFYDQVAWQQGPDGVYVDALLFEDMREVSRAYIHKCHLRVNRYLKPGGKFLLDVASGPIQYPEYLMYADKFEYRLCVDISAVALRAARKRLGARGLYVLSDITALPFKENSLDGAISLHTIYHVPAARQEIAFAEIYRVLRPGARAVVVYSWGKNSLLMKLFLFPRNLLKFVLKPINNLLRPKSQTALPLYFHTHNHRWFEKHLRPRFPYEIFVWRSVSVPFLRTFIHKRLVGKKLLSWLYRLEEKYPCFFGKIGQYPLIVFDKSRP